ncbi:MAG: ubiquinol-cytochrome c reductase iron-sulfur subunit [Candidatus Omnitrophica bacterium]|nr:ubiquinol-cytochrome c reductase iron-sulfur subunit [Candidatus Omnitrophota bacterium]MDE2009723.1 ubiquinol-cytochrome c reductase iron-sulfur subunit [Candidatus Omnitrophota bacterium]MDE2213880.1 ubiquinol-cytochrome c reductase iron-sulfur subunit [Candidatus Omnitrophota bacterium]MDE2231861.1 ubiquinol-cytochrome c reductase iron-sulfur subunit [Candidatus Omnitrophota bacterium]
MTDHHPTPRPEEPEDIQKRNFIKTLTVAILGFITFFLTQPFVTYLFPVAKEGTKEKFIKVPNFPAIPLETPTKMTFEYMDVQAYITSNVIYDVWVVKHAADKASVYNPLCTHLNCRYTWVGSHHEFMCPCHGSIFNINGKVVGGPAPRPLDTLPYKIEGGELYVHWELFKAGIPQKLEI